MKKTLVMEVNLKCGLQHLQNSEHVASQLEESDVERSESSEKRAII